MFTLKFYDHDFVGQADDTHEVFACERYSVKAEQRADEGQDSKGKESFTVVRMFRSLDDDNPYYQTVGPYEAYGTVYVMNDKGKTIDTIR